MPRGNVIKAAGGDAIFDKEVLGVFEGRAEIVQEGGARATIRKGQSAVLKTTQYLLAGSHGG